MADSTAGGRQIDGFHGISLEYMRSRMFMHADGGYGRVVWMPQETKERLQEFIPTDVYSAIATELDVKNIEELRTFLENHHHPVTRRWAAASENVEEIGSQIPVFSGVDIPITTAGFRIILKNAKITAEKVIIQPIRPPGKTGGEHGGTKKQ
jgi:acetyl-CoA decarbonylase/synthase complex subunit beta